MKLADILADNSNVVHKNLTSLEGAPKIIHGDFHCSDNNLTSLEGAPSVIEGDLYAERNKLTSLKNIHKHINQIDGYLLTDGNKIMSHVLGLLLIKNLQGVGTLNGEIDDPAGSIINKYLPNDRGMDAVFDCQEELIEAGFEEYAQL